MTERTSPPAPQAAWMLVALIVAGAALGLWLVTLWLPSLLTRTAGPSLSGPTPVNSPATAAPESRRIHASLFFLSAAGDRLEPVESEVLFAPSPAEQARRLVEAQVGPAPAGRVSPIPVGTTVRHLYLTGRGDAYLDLSADIRRGHAGGSLAEALTVYALVNTLTVNMPDISAVQLLIEGQEVDTLVGHLDLRHPLRRGARWIER